MDYMERAARNVQRGFGPGTRHSYLHFAGPLLSSALGVLETDLGEPEAMETFAGELSAGLLATGAFALANSSV